LTRESTGGSQWQHVAAEHIEVVQRIYQRQLDSPKTRNSVRSVAMSVGLRGAMNPWRETAVSTAPDAWVFPSETGLTPIQMENIWRRNFRPRLERVGLDPKLVADQLGHTLDVSLNIYAKLGLDRLTEALELFESRLRSNASKAA